MRIEERQRRSPFYELATVPRQSTKPPSLGVRSFRRRRRLRRVLWHRRRRMKPPDAAFANSKFSKRRWSDWRLSSEIEMQKQLQELKQGVKGVNLDELDLTELDTGRIRALKIRALEKEKNELEKKLEVTGRRIDHLERAFRQEERTHLAEDYEKQRERDLAIFEKSKKDKLKEAEQKHKDDVALRNRVQRLVPTFDEFKKSITAQRAAEFEKRRRQAQKELDQKMDARKREVRERKARERREREERERQEREEEERRVREEEEKTRVEEERKQKLAEERERREAERKSVFFFAILTSQQLILLLYPDAWTKSPPNNANAKLKLKSVAAKLRKPPLDRSPSAPASAVRKPVNQLPAPLRADLHDSILVATNLLGGSAKKPSSANPPLLRLLLHHPMCPRKKPNCPSAPATCLRICVIVTAPHLPPVAHGI
jgi:hypothetical protein